MQIQTGLQHVLLKLKEKKNIVKNLSEIKVKGLYINRSTRLNSAYYKLLAPSIYLLLWWYMNKLFMSTNYWIYFISSVYLTFITYLHVICRAFIISLIATHKFNIVPFTKNGLWREQYFVNNNWEVLIDDICNGKFCLTSTSSL